MKWHRRSIAGSRSWANAVLTATRIRIAGQPGSTAASATPPAIFGSRWQGPREPSSRAITTSSGCARTPICPGTRTRPGLRGARAPAVTPRPPAPLAIARTCPKATRRSGVCAVTDQPRHSIPRNAGCVTSPGRAFSAIGQPRRSTTAGLGAPCMDSRRGVLPTTTATSATGALIACNATRLLDR
jgi:hypothetical protein